jgi:V8-like Glu-specific endopeptidase
MLSLDKRWFKCTVRHSGGALWISDATDIGAGMSGSPLLADDGSAIGIVWASAGNDGSDHPFIPRVGLTRD